MSGGPRRRPWGRVALLAGVALLVGGRAVLWDLRRLEGWSMTPGLRAGEVLLLRRVGPVRPGDVVLVRLGTDPQRYVKRVIAGPGSVVEEVDGRLLVDGQALARGEARPGEALRACRTEAVELLDEGVGERRWTTVPGTASAGVVEVPEGHWFVAGDDRARSRDSRQWGVLTGDEVDGVVVAVLPGPDPCGGGWAGGRLLLQ